MTENLIEDIKKEIGTDKKIKVAINGFGRIGRMIFRAGFDDPQIEFVVINDLSSADSLRYYLQYDSSQGTFKHKVNSDDDNNLIIGEKKIPVIAEKDVSNLPWKNYDIDVVAECTGLFTDNEKAKLHIEQGAKKVLISAPAKGDVFFLVKGANEHDYKGENIVSNGSCTTNSMTAIIYELNKKYGIKKGMFSTIHSLTADQKILDSNHKKLRRGRSAPFNIVPTTTGAANAVTKIIPELKGKLHGIAYRVPTAVGSITDLNLELNQNITKEEINNFLEELSNTQLHGIIEYSKDEIVSSDIIGNPHSGIIDSFSTEVVDNNMVKIAIWYDNEFGFSNRMIEVIKLISK